MTVVEARSSRFVAPIAAGVALLAAAAVAPWDEFGDRINLGDIRHYHTIASEILDGRIPYHHFFVEYPPAALATFLLPTAAAHSVGAYGLVFRSSILVVAVAAVALAAATVDRLGADSRRLVATAAYTGSAPLLLGPIFFDRYDMWPAAVVGLGMLFALKGANRSAAVAFAVGAAAKVYPALLVPLLILRVRARCGSRAAVRCGAFAAATFAVIVGPFAAIAPGGVGFSFKTQLTRVLEIESLSAAALLCLHRVGAYVPTIREGLSFELVGHAPVVLGTLQTMTLGAGVVAIWWVFWRQADADEAFVLAAAATLAVIVALDKVLSPQYLVWLVPLVALLWGRVAAVAWALSAAAMVLTVAYFPWSFRDLRQGGSTAWIVFARDAVLVALAVWLVAALVRCERRA